MNKWTGEEEIFLKRNYKRLTDREIAEKLGRTRSSITGKRRIMGLIKGRGRVGKEVLKKIKILARKLGRSPHPSDDRRLATAARDHFGSWDRAKKLADLEEIPNKRGRDSHKCGGTYETQAS